MTDDEKDEFEAHYFECDTCFAELEFTKSLAQLIKSEGRELLTDPKPVTIPFLQRLKRFFNDTFKSSRVPAFAGVLVSVVVVTAFLVSYQGKTIFATVDYAREVPYPYQASSMRGASENQDDSLFAAFQDQFTQAMSEYLQLHYSAAAELLAAMQPDVKLLEQRAEQLEVHEYDRIKISSDVNKYYFYRGVNSLALAKEKSIHNAMPDIDSALNFLRKANAVAKLNEVGDRSREFYFIALCQAMQNNSENARITLQKISVGDEFYAQRLKLMEKLSD
ncbi:hypothetical protein KC799_22345 [candidate division KSB1 bacterium]|nr:hypothetical protein [candidate division KSB1 bacterium]